MNIIKKINKIMLLLVVFGVVFTFNTQKVEAASFSVSSSASSVSAGGKVTVTIKASDCGGKFSVSASGGAKVSSSSLWVENGSSSVTVTAPSSGSFTVTVSASDVAYSDGSAMLTGSKSVSVSVKSSSSSSSSSSNSSSSSSSSSSSTTTEVKKSSVNTLSKLSIDKGSLSPEFAAGTTNYNVIVTDQEEITISATAKDSKASVSGTGKKTLKVGDNSFSVVVTAEDGSKKTYTIGVEVRVTPTVFAMIGELSLGVVETPYTITVPATFEASTTVIEDEEVSAWTDANSGLEIVCLVDENETEKFYVVDEGEIISEFRSTAVLGINVYVLDVIEEEQEKAGLVYGEVEVDGQVMPGWSFEDETFEAYKLIKLMKHNGEEIEYLYSVQDNTMVSFDVDKFMNTTELDAANENVAQLTELKNDLTADLDTTKMFAMAAGAVAVLSTIGVGISLSLGRGYKKDYLKLQEYNKNPDILDDDNEDISTLEEDFIDYE